MTDTPIAALIEAVEAGRDITCCPWSILGETWGEACRAYVGSLDAAKKLHDKMLPGWVATIGIHEDWCVVMVGPLGTKDQDIKVKREGSPARAWLLAILRAHQSQQETGQ